MLFWAIGTFAFSIVLVTEGIAPLLNGWLGIVAGISVGLFNGLRLTKHKIAALQAIGALSAILFELLTAVWLLTYI